MRANVSFSLGALLILLAGALTTSAATNGFFVPAFRGQPGSTFDGWESFSVGVGSPGNLGDLTGSSATANLLQKASGGMVLGSGNLYNGENPSQFEIRYGGDAQVEQVILQIRTLGTELSYDSVKMFAWTESMNAPRTEL